MVYSCSWNISFVEDMGSDSLPSSRIEGISKTLERKIQRKQKRLQHMIKNETGIECFDTPKKNLIVCNAGLTTGLDAAAVVTAFTQFGAISDVRMLPGKSYCFVECTDAAEAAKIYCGAHAKSSLGQHGSPVYLTYCESVPTNDASARVDFDMPPGLTVIQEFISEADEQRLINLIRWTDDDADDNNAGSTLKHRQVKHFGYEFRYDTNNVNANQPLADAPLPTECDFLWARHINTKAASPFIERPHQLTVNRYQPGQGIPPHVDTHSAFTDTIVSLSLAGDVVMEFRKLHPTNAKEYERHVSVQLPRRSLLIMSGEARYGWKHGITPRKIDIVPNTDGGLTAKHRSLRLSYTFRWLSNTPCTCEYHSLCDTYKETNDKTSQPSESMDDPSKCELENVHNVYNEIANHFSETRHSPWPRVTEFLQRFDGGSILVDVGCGNGKYLYAQPDMVKIGCDRSDGLLGVCRDRGFNVFQCDCLAVPIKSESVDGCYSIAVIHHLASEERRLRAIGEMIRILRTDGLALIYVWAKNQSFKNKSKYLKRDDDDDEQSKTIPAQPINALESDGRTILPIHTNRTQFTHSDMLVPWKLKPANPSTATKVETNQKTIVDDKPTKTFLRYYHVFEENELLTLCSRFKNISIVDSYYDQGNWCIIFRKTA